MAPCTLLRHTQSRSSVLIALLDPFQIVKAVREFLLSPVTLKDNNWPTLISFSLRAASPLVVSSSSQPSAKTPPAGSNLITLLKTNNELFELLLRVLAAEQLSDIDLLSDRAREAVLLVERFGDLRCVPGVLINLYIVAAN